MSTEMLISDNGILARAELDVQISTAKAYPRIRSKAIEDAAEMVTMSQETAESCFYVLSRNGKDGSKSEIKGPSIRLAEIAASSWGNLHAATRIVENDGKFITAEAVCWDLEKNVKMSSQVKRSIQYKNGGTFNADMQAVTGNAASSIALRNSILKVIPKALIDRLYEIAVKHSIGDQKSIDSRRKAIFDRFKKLNIDQSKILIYLGKSMLEEVDTKDMETLIGIGTAIKDGMLSIENAFSLDNQKSMTESAQERINSLLGENNVK